MRLGMIKKSNINHLIFFGCLAYAHVLNENKRKLDEKSEVCILIRYCKNTKVYRLYNQKNHMVVIYRDMIFDEKGMYGHQKL